MMVPPQDLSGARRASEVFHNFVTHPPRGYPFGAAAFIAHDGKWLRLHFPWPILPGIIILMVRMSTTKKTGQQSVRAHLQRVVNRDN